MTPVKIEEKRKKNMNISRKGDLPELKTLNEDKLEQVDPQEFHIFSKDPLMLTLLILKFMLWCLLMALFTFLEFGTVFFILSIFYLIFANFRESKKAVGELSAYSVFNPNCEQIDGTLTAQQFETEIRFGHAALH